MSYATKPYNRTTFRLNRHISVVCYAQDTRNGFRHIAEANDYMGTSAKCTYLNRTWERYTFQSVLYKLINHMRVSDRQKTIWKRKADDIGLGRVKTNLHTMGAFMALGELMGRDEAERNALKAKVVTHGLGLELGDDYEALDEATKAERLGLVQDHLLNGDDK